MKLQSMPLLHLLAAVTNAVLMTAMQKQIVQCTQFNTPNARQWEILQEITNSSSEEPVVKSSSWSQEYRPQRQDESKPVQPPSNFFNILNKADYRKGLTIMDKRMGSDFSASARQDTERTT